MFRFRNLRPTISSTATGNSKSVSTSSVENRRSSDQEIELDDPLLLRLNHRRQLEEEKGKGRTSNGGDKPPEVFMGWDHGEKDPFDLGSTSSENEEEECTFQVNYNDENEDQVEESEDFVGWGAGSRCSTMDATNDEIFLTELSIKGGLSSTSSFLEQPDADNLSDAGSYSKRRASVNNFESINESPSVGNDDPSTSGTSANGSRGWAQDNQPQIFICSTKEGTEECESPLPRPYMFRRSITSGSNNSQHPRRMSGGSGSDCTESSPNVNRIRRRQSLGDLLSKSLQLGADTFKPTVVQQKSFKIDSTHDEDEECPRLQQLKEESKEELHHELVRIQVQSKSNLESSWSEAERLRQDNEELDEKISQLKLKLAKAKLKIAAASEAASSRNSPSQESCGAALSQSTQQTKKSSALNFSAINALRRSNYFDDFSAVRTRSESDDRVEKKKKPRPRRRTFMAEFSSNFSITSSKAGSNTLDQSTKTFTNALDRSLGSSCRLGMNIEDISERTENLSGLYSQCYDDNPSEAGSGIMSRAMSRDGGEGENRSHTGSNIGIEDQDNVSEIRSAIDSLHSGEHFTLSEDHRIFLVEPIKLMLEDLSEQVTANSEETTKIVAALRKQDDQIKALLSDIERVRSFEEVKKLQELERLAIQDLDDFNRCFRAIDGKLETIEVIAFEMKQTLELNESNDGWSFESVQLNKGKLCRAKEMMGGDSDRRSVLDIINDVYMFKHYKDCREEIVGNIYRIDFLEADLWNHLVQIRILIDQVEDDEGTQTTESSMASERRALERVFVEAIIPHVAFAHLTINNLLVAFRENVKILKWWNHLIDGIECFKSYNDMTSCIEFIANEPTAPLKKDLSVLRRILEVTKEDLDEVEADINKECTSFRSKVERVGLGLGVNNNNDNGNTLSTSNSYPSLKEESLLKPDNIRNNALRSKLMEKKRAIAVKDKVLKHHAARLELLHSNAQQEIGKQLGMLDKMQSQLQFYTQKLEKQDSLLLSLTDLQKKKEERVLHFQKIAGRKFMGND